MSGVLKIFMITSPNLIILNILVYKIKPNFTKIWNIYYKAMFK